MEIMEYIKLNTACVKYNIQVKQEDPSNKNQGAYTPGHLGINSDQSASTQHIIRENPLYKMKTIWKFYTKLLN